MVQVMVVRVDIGVDIGMLISEARTPQCGSSVVQVLFVRVNIGGVPYEATTTQCLRSVVQILFIREVQRPGCQRRYRSGDL